MKRTSISVTLMLLSSTCLSMGSNIVNAVTVNAPTSDAKTLVDQTSHSFVDTTAMDTNEINDSSESLVTAEISEGASDIDSSEETIASNTKDSIEINQDETEEQVQTDQDKKTVAKEKFFKVNFKTTGEHLFVDREEGDCFEMTIEKQLDDSLSLKDFPTFGYSLDNLQLSGWQDSQTRVIYTTAELLKLKVTSDLNLMPVFLEPTYPNVFGLADLPPLPVDKKIKEIKSIFSPAVGSGPEYSSDGKILLINPAKKSQLGAIWSKKRLNMKKDFMFKAYLNMGASKADGADGITFTIHNDPKGKKAIANSGQGLGAYSISGKKNYINNAISIEFDTYYNGGSKDPMDSDFKKNDNKGHIAFVTPSENNNQKNQHSEVTYPSDYLSNGTWRTVTFTWDATQQNLTYDLSGVGSGTHHISNVEQQFAGTFVDWGFTSSTGGKFQDNAVAITDVPSSVNHTASIKNETANDPDFSQGTIGAPGDTVSITDTIDLDDSEPKFGKDALVEVDLTGLSYQEESLYLNDVLVPKSNISYTNNKLKISIGDMMSDSEQSAKLNLKAQVGDLPLGSTHNYYFTYTEDGVSSDSNFIDVTIPTELNKTIKVNYLDMATDKEISEATEITGKIGTAYKATPKVISGYELVKDSGNTSGVLDKNAKDVSFYYQKGVLSLKEVPAVFDFKTHNISTKDLTVWPELKGKLVVSDKRGVASSGWHLNVKETQALQNDNQSLGHVLNLSDGQNKAAITSADLTVKSSENDGETVISDGWGQERKAGISADIPVEKQLKGDFKGTLEWALLDTP